jgi:hypothetical protein
VFGDGIVPRNPSTSSLIEKRPAGQTQSVRIRYAVPHCPAFQRQDSGPKRRSSFRARATVAASCSSDSPHERADTPRTSQAAPVARSLSGRADAPRLRVLDEHAHVLEGIERPSEFLVYV